MSIRIVKIILLSPLIILILFTLLSLRGFCWQYFDRVSEWGYWEKAGVSAFEKDKDLEDCGLTKSKFTYEDRAKYILKHSERERRNCPSILWKEQKKGKWFRDRRYCTEITEATDQCMFSKGYKFIKHPDVEYYSKNSCQSDFRCRNGNGINLPSCTQSDSWFGNILN